MLVRPADAMAWELRAAWAAGWRVSVSLDARCEQRRLEGLVQRVSATGAFVVIAGWHVPMDAVLAVHRPSRLGDSSHRGGEWAGARWEPPQAEELPLPYVVVGSGDTREATNKA